MKSTPLVTLVAGLGLGAVLIIVNMISTSGGADGPAFPAAAAPTASAAPSATPSAATPSAATPSAEQPAAKVTASWAGPVNGGGASIAIAVNEGVAVAYLCDGKKAEAWLQGTAADGRLVLTGKGGASLTGAFGNGKATGAVTAAGRRFAFTVAAVAKPSGLYRATANVRNAKVVGGWIVLPDGSQVGVVTTDGAPAAAAPLALPAATATVDGETITAAPVTGPLDAS